MRLSMARRPRDQARRRQLRLRVREDVDAVLWVPGRDGTEPRCGVEMKDSTRALLREMLGGKCSRACGDRARLRRFRERHKAVVADGEARR